MPGCLPAYHTELQGQTYTKSYKKSWTWTEFVRSSRTWLHVSPTKREKKVGLESMSLSCKLTFLATVRKSNCVGRWWVECRLASCKEQCCHNPLECDIRMWPHWVMSLSLGHVPYLTVVTVDSFIMRKSPKLWNYTNFKKVSETFDCIIKSKIYEKICRNSVGHIINLYRQRINW